MGTKASAAGVKLPRFEWTPQHLPEVKVLEGEDGERQWKLANEVNKPNQAWLDTVADVPEEW